MKEAISASSAALTALMKVKGVGRRAALRIINSPLPQDDVKYRFLNLAAQAKLPTEVLSEAWERTQDELERTRFEGIKFFSFHDEGYPKRLRNIPDPPAMLYVKGDVAGLNAPKSLAVIGTREPTQYGEKVARRSASTAAEAGFVIVSGLAHGCDTYGHEGCLDAHGTGIAVMAHGLDKIYPAANRGLAGRLLEFGGCLVSEYPLGVTPMRQAFAERDRIQSGLSDAVLVIETDVKGGTMHTVRFSREQHRALACIKHPSNWNREDKTRGNQQLIAQNIARGVSDGAELIAFLNKIKDARSLTFETNNKSPADRSQTSMAF
ncbi:DNA-protecting protein DprA [Hoeflea sp. WL0058]|uniref:DNA-protecting protein DprA n=1 Tax=Flavimaribacter sediminis TaxID=2865987 RepID=A0AAE3D2P1_9HYPH|nr:DNA-processing protein DprA [Flavimaribacter sediminis]MBW8639036.1 DNA-protecting protein DprA [Flavimaribacter sediminis]